MTSLEEARQRVIDAAREWKEDLPETTRYLKVEAMVLIDAVDALDALERPDPWELLREVKSHMATVSPFPDAGFTGRIDAALAWRRENPDA